MPAAPASTSNRGNILPLPGSGRADIRNMSFRLGCFRGAILAPTTAPRASAFIEILFISFESNTRERGVLFQANSVSWGEAWNEWRLVKA